MFYVNETESTASDCFLLGDEHLQKQCLEGVLNSIPVHSVYHAYDFQTILQNTLCLVANVSYTNRVPINGK